MSLELLESGKSIFDLLKRANKDAFKNAILDESDPNGEKGLAVECQVYGAPGVELQQSSMAIIIEQLSKAVDAGVPILSELVANLATQEEIDVTIFYLREQVKEALKPIQDDVLLVNSTDSSGITTVKKIEVKHLNLHRFFEASLKLQMEIETVKKNSGTRSLKEKKIRQQYLSLKNSDAVQTIEALTRYTQQLATDNPDLQEESTPGDDYKLSNRVITDLKKAFASIGKTELDGKDDGDWLDEDSISNALEALRAGLPVSELALKRLRNLAVILAGAIAVKEFTRFGKSDKDTIQEAEAEQVKKKLDEVLQLAEKKQKGELIDDRDFEAWKLFIDANTRVDGMTLGSFLVKTAAEIDNGSISNQEEANKVIENLTTAFNVVDTQKTATINSGAIYEDQDDTGYNHLLKQKKVDFLTKKIEQVGALLELVPNFDQPGTRVDRGTNPRVGKLEIPVQHTEKAWQVAYGRVLEGRTQQAISDFIREQLYLFEEVEGDYSELKSLKDSEEGSQFKGLVSWMKEEIRNGSTYLARFEKYLSNRLEIAERMGPDAASDKITGDYLSAVEKNYPAFSESQYHYYLGTKSKGEYEQYEHYKAVRTAAKKIELYLTEQYDFMAPVAEYKKSDGSHTEGFLSLGRGKWMSGEGNYHTKLCERLTEDLKAKYPEITDDREIARIVRISFSLFALAGGKGHLFQTYYAFGMSPPELAEIGYMSESYPEAKAFNLATKAVAEIPSVVMGMHVDRRWLLKMATKIGIYAFVDGEARVRGDNYTEGKLWGIAGAPDLSSPHLFNGYINSMSEEECEVILNSIRDSELHHFNESTQKDEYITDGTFTRVRNLLRSIRLSEAKCKYLKMYKSDRKMPLMNLDGSSSDVGDLMAPLNMPPWLMVAGATEFIDEDDDSIGYFAGWGTHFKESQVKEHNNLKAFYERIYAQPPKLERGRDHHAHNIALLADDFFQCLGLTSGLKKQVEQANWPKVVELFEYRLHILFAAYAEAGYPYPWQEPVQSLVVKLKDITGYELEIHVHSLVDTFHKMILDSGQTMGGKGESTWMSIANQAKIGDKPDSTRGQNGKPKKYLTIDNEERELKGALLSILVKDGPNMSKVSGGLYQGGPETRGKAFAPLKAEYDNIKREYEVHHDSLSNVLLPMGLESERSAQAKEVAEAEKGGKSH